MGKGTASVTGSLESIRHKYLEQLSLEKYTRIDFENKFSYKPLVYFEASKYNFHEEVDKFIVCQWLIIQSDWRFESYVPYILVPEKQEDIGSLSLYDVFELITPSNIINSKSVTTTDSE